MVKQTHSHDVSTCTIGRLYKQSVGEVDEQKEKMLAASAEVPIAMERVRLERDEALYQLSQKLSGDKDKITHGLAVLREAREESKNAVQPNIFQFNQFNTLSDEELLAKKKQIERKILDIKKVEVTDGALAGK